MRSMPIIQIPDVRDGLYPALREILAGTKAIIDKSNGHYRRSQTVVDQIGEELHASPKLVYDLMVDMTSPRCSFPLVEGHGIFGMVPAHPRFSELRLHEFYRSITENKAQNTNEPLPMPIPYALVTGTVGYAYNGSKVPPHNAGQVIDAAVAMLRDPDISTEELLTVIKGPELYVGGTLANPEELIDIYETGKGTFQFKTTEKTLNPHMYDSPVDFCNWYGLECFPAASHRKGAYDIEVEYNAVFFDGKEERRMSLREILKNYLDFYKMFMAEQNGSLPNIDTLCEALTAYKSKV